jgi:hypothetical protein
MDTAAVLTRHGGALAMYAMLARSATSDLLGRRQTVSHELNDFTQQLAQPNVFNHVVETDSFHEGVVVAAQAAAFAAGEYNTVMLGLPALSRQDQDYTRMLINLSRINRNILLLKKGPRPWGALRGPITVWWGGQENNVRLMLILAYLLQNASESPPRIQLKTIVSDASQTTDVEQRLQESVRELRVPADTAVVVNSDGSPIPEVLARESHDAALTVLGMAKPDQSMIRGYLTGLRTTTAGLGTTLLVMNNIPEIRYV